MKYVRLVCAVLLALVLIVFGGNYFVQAFPLPAGDGSIGSDLLQMMRDGGLMTFVAASHVLIGVMLLIPRTRTLAALLQLPITLGMVAFHASMQPAGLAVALLMLALNIGAGYDLDRLRPLWT